jgi:hypothetical protein
MSGTQGQKGRYCIVPRFYFHLYNDMDVPDREGKELPDLDAARQWTTCQARSLLGQVAKDEGLVVLHHRIDIENDAAEVLDTVWFRDAVKVED